MQEMVERYLAAWNEKDAERRRRLVDALWTEDGSYTDPLADASGRAEIDGLIGAVQQQFPGFVFTLGGPVEQELAVQGGAVQRAGAQPASGHARAFAVW